MRQLLSGAVAAFALVAAFSFRRFALRSRDRFFNLFAAAFLLMAANNVALGLTDRDAEGRAALYVVRLVAFGIIVFAIWDKNRR